MKLILTVDADYDHSMTLDVVVEKDVVERINQTVLAIVAEALKHEEKI